MCVWKELYQKLITDEFESRFDLKTTGQLANNSNLCFKNQSFEINNLRNKKKLFRTNSFTTNLCQQQTKNQLAAGKDEKLKNQNQNQNLILICLQVYKNLKI